MVRPLKLSVGNSCRKFRKPPTRTKTRTPRNPERKAKTPTSKPPKIKTSRKRWTKNMTFGIKSGSIHRNRPRRSAGFSADKSNCKCRARLVFISKTIKNSSRGSGLDNFDATEKLAGSNDITITKPSSWVILWRTNESKPIDGIEPDFDGIYVLAYSKYDQEHYSAYRVENVWGRLPLKVEGSGDNKSFTVQLRGTDGKLAEKRFTVVKTGNRLKGQCAAGYCLKVKWKMILPVRFPNRLK